VDGWLPRGELVRYDSRSRQFAAFLSGISAGELDFSRDGKWVAYMSYPEHTSGAVASMVAKACSLHMRRLGLSCPAGLPTVRGSHTSPSKQAGLF
jgi:hypothetical protein